MVERIDLNDDDVFLSYDEVRRGASGQGVVWKVDAATGIVVHFYNRVHAKIPIKFLMQQGVSDTVDSFRVGKPVKCIIIRKRNVCVCMRVCMYVYVCMCVCVCVCV